MSDNPVFSYTKRDYERARKEGIAQIPILSKGNWTDLNATDPGIIILDYVHALVDMINFYQDHQALESFIPTAKERANIFRLAKQFNYKIRSSKGALVTVNFHSDLKYDHPIKIPKYTTVSTYNNIRYFTNEDAYLLAGQTDVSIQCVQGERHERIYKGTGVSTLTNTESQSNQYVNLISPNIDTDSIIIVDNLNRTWKPVDYIVFSKSSERVYQVELNPDNTVTILFGDGERGVVPSITDKLNIYYTVNNGEEGRIEAGAITLLDDYIYDEGKYIEFTVSNSESSIGGYSAQSSSSIRELAPGIIKAQDRAVTLNDFENLAKQIEGVSAVKAYDINIAPDLCLHHEVKVLVVPDSGQEDSKDLLLGRVYNYLYNRMIPPTNLQVISPSYTLVDIEISAIKLANYDASAIEYQIYNQVKDYFLGISTAIGETYYPMELMNEISNIEGIRYLSSFTPNTPIEIDKLSVAKLGNISITVK